MRKRSRVAAVLASTSLVVTACSLSTSLDEFSRGAPSDGPGADVDAASGDGARDPADGRDASGNTTLPDAGDDSESPNLHPRGTFENGTCDGWTDYQGTLTPSDVAHTGTGSCMACTRRSTPGTFTADDVAAPGPAIVGATYLAEGWVRLPPGVAVPTSVELVLRSYATNTYKLLESSGSPKQVLDGEWRRLSTTLKVTQSGGLLNVYIEAEHQPGACCLLDDIVVRRID